MKGIQRKIILNTTVITLILALVTSAVLFVASGRLVGGTLTETLGPFAQIASRTVESNLHLMADRILLLSENEQLTSPETTKAQLKDKLDYMASGIEFVWLSLYTPDGKLYTGYGNGPAEITGGRLYTLMTETGNLVVDDTAVTDQGLEIAVGAPVYIDSEVAYYLVGSYRYDLLNDVLGSIHIGHSGYALVVGEDGRILAHQDKEVVSERQTIDSLFAGDDALLSLFERVQAGIVGAESVRIDGRDTYVAYSPVRGANWSLAILVPSSDFMGIANLAVGANMLVVILLLVLALVITARYSGRISRSLGYVTGRIQGLAKGDLTSPVDVLATRDEAQDLSVALRDTIADVSGYVRKLKEALSALSEGNLNIWVDGEFAGDFVVMKDSLSRIIDFLNEIMDRLQQSAGSLSDRAHQMDFNAQALHSASENQSQSVSRLMGQTQVISQDIGEVDKHAKTAYRLMDETMDKLSQGNAQMRSMLDAMEKIRANADEINKITKFMEDIAFQTHILAINASVEAAHAGAAGRGFAVVADEVSELAQKSAESSKRTAEMIEYSRRAIAEGMASAQRTAQAMEELEGISRQVVEITDELALSVDREKGALESVTEDISGISRLAGENLQFSQSVASISSELKTQARELQEMSERFTLRGAGGSLPRLAGQDGMALLEKGDRS